MGQSPVVVPEDNTESIKYPTEVSLIEELDETELKTKQIIDKEEFVEEKPESFVVKQETVTEVKKEVVVLPDGTELNLTEEMPNKNTTESGQLVGGVSMNL